MKIKRLPYKFIVAVIFRSFTLISALIIFLISSFLYGPEGRGAISLLTALYAVLGLLLSFGIGRTVYQKVTRTPNHSAELYTATIRFINIISLVVALGSILAFAAYEGMAPKWKKGDFLNFIIFLPYFPYAIWQYISNYFYTATKKTSLHDKATIITRSAQIALMLAVVPLKIRLESFLLFYGTTSFLIYVVESKLLLKENAIHHSWQNSIRALYNLKFEIKWPYIDSLSQMLAPLAVFIMGLIITKEELGHYNFSLQIISTLFFPLWLLSIKVQESLSNAPPKERKRIIKTGFISIIPVSAILMVCALSIPFLLPHVGLSKFKESMSILNALILTVPLAGLFYMFLAIWVATHKAKFSSLLTIASGITNILCIIGFGKKIGPWAGVVGFYFSYILSLLGSSIYLKKIWNSMT